MIQKPVSIGMPALKTYRELNDEQRQHADRMPYLLGASIDDPIFTVKDGEVVAVNTRAREIAYAGGWGYFCFECREAFSAEIQHTSCSMRYIYPVHTLEQANLLAGQKTLREQLESAQ